MTGSWRRTDCYEQALAKEIHCNVSGFTGHLVQRKIRIGFWREGSEVRALSVLAEDLSPLPSIHVKWLTTAWIPAPGDPTCSWVSCEYCTHMAYTHRHIKTQKETKNYYQVLLPVSEMSQLTTYWKTSSTLYLFFVWGVFKVKKIQL